MDGWLDRWWMDGWGLAHGTGIATGIGSVSAEGVGSTWPWGGVGGDVKHMAKRGGVRSSTWQREGVGPAPLQTRLGVQHTAGADGKAASLSAGHTVVFAAWHGQEQPSTRVIATQTQNMSSCGCSDGCGPVCTCVA
eukprot:363582-Chlamydomonas_euryale.AAC.5